jgi:Ca-activated chloride channel family protein
MMRRVLCLACGLLTLSISLAGQPAVFRSSVELVRLDVSVRRSDRPVAGLRAGDFVLTDNGRTQRIESASLESMPLSVLLVLDTSGSMAGARFGNLIAGAKDVVKALRPDDRVALVTFSSRISQSVELTADLPRVERALDELTPNGGTSLRDAVYASLKVTPAPGSRGIVLVFSDGLDTVSWLTSPQIVGAVKAADVVIYGVELTDTPSGPIAPSRGDPILVPITENTGGRRWVTSRSARIGPLLLEALADMRARYLLTYYPEPPVTPGWHALKVTLKAGRADILTRPGYLVP